MNEETKNNMSIYCLNNLCGSVGIQLQGLITVTFRDVVKRME
jgi:hypothetical protein